MNSKTEFIEDSENSYCCTSGTLTSLDCPISILNKPYHRGSIYLRNDSAGESNLFKFIKSPIPAVVCNSEINTDIGLLTVHNFPVCNTNPENPSNAYTSML